MATTNAERNAERASIIRDAAAKNARARAEYLADKHGVIDG